MLDLLASEKQIEEERENAKKIKDRLNGKSSEYYLNLKLAVGGTTAIGSNTSY